MDIMELGAIGEMVGGIAVMGSLLFVGFQVRQSVEQTRQTNAKCRRNGRPEANILRTLRPTWVDGVLRDS